MVLMHYLIDPYSYNPQEMLRYLEQNKTSIWAAVRFDPWHEATLISTIQPEV
jgi:hypothetical protein